jgi:hypothetical protein
MYCRSHIWRRRNVNRYYLHPRPPLLLPLQKQKPPLPPLQLLLRLPLRLLHVLAVKKKKRVCIMIATAIRYEHKHQIRATKPTIKNTFNSFIVLHFFSRMYSLIYLVLITFPALHGTRCRREREWMGRDSFIGNTR